MLMDFQENNEQQFIDWLYLCYDLFFWICYFFPPHIIRSCAIHTFLKKRKVFIWPLTQLPLLAVDSSRRSLTMMLMLCLKKACRYPKRCAPQRTNQAGKVTTSRTVKKAFSLWWPKSRLSSRVSDGEFVQCGVHMPQIKTCACLKWVVLDL